MRGRARSSEESILQRKEDWDKCWLCMELYGDYSTKRILDKHHIYGGAFRGISEAEGFTVRLCKKHHASGGPEDVHMNYTLNKALKVECQREYESRHSREEFMRLIHRNYLEE